MPILEMRNISKSFGLVCANDNVNLCIKKGSIHALLGENGAGKTTLMNILFGLYKADFGEILYKGETVDFSSAQVAINHGIGMVHQHFSLVRKLSVLDNIILGMKSDSIKIDRKSIEAKIIMLSKKYNLHVNPKSTVASLSIGEQQRVEILKALYKNVEVLILDEPTGVLTPNETADFFNVLRKLKDEGHAIVIITHRMSEIMDISDEISILRDGKKVIDLHTADTNPEELATFMIGKKIVPHQNVRQNISDNVLLSLKNINVLDDKKILCLDNISIDVKKGEILGIAGVDGNGQNHLAEVIVGISKLKSGNISMLGDDITLKSVKSRFNSGITYISDDRHSDGLVMQMNVQENLILKDYKTFAKNGFLNFSKIYNNATTQIDKYKIKGLADTKVRFMSGGNQQKIIISREVCDNAKLVIANQPTRGLDMGATDFVRKTLLEHTERENSVVLISADLEEIMQLSDRVAVMYAGQIVGVVEKHDITKEKIGMLMGGVTNEN